MGYFRYLCLHNQLICKCGEVRADNYHNLMFNPHVDLINSDLSFESVDTTWIDSVGASSEWCVRLVNNTDMTLDIVIIPWLYLPLFVTECI